ncbi:MAG TPA: SNF2-related protein, partial [Stellaceae bacterium]|nr:SNF2-related protein [Stellaceae bacterium]
MLPGVRVLRGAIVSPCNAAPIVERLLRAARIAVSTHAPKRTGPTDARLALPYLRPWVPAFLVAYQRAAVSFLLARPDQSGLVIHPPGAGKTLTAIVWALALPGLIVVVTKAAVRHQWLREIARYTVLTGELLEGQTARDLGSKGAGLPRFLVVGHETLPHWIDELERVGPCSVVFDESHRIRSWRRWTAIEDGEHADGSARLRFAVRENIAAAAMRLSRGAERRICTTATPIVNLLRDLWSQTDLGDPGGFGGFYCWAKRYCAATQDSWGGIDTRGMSNLAELRERLEDKGRAVPFGVEVMG